MSLHCNDEVTGRDSLTHRHSHFYLRILDTSALFSPVLQIQEKIEVARDVHEVGEEDEPSSDRPHKQIRLGYLGQRVQTRLVKNQAGTVWPRFALGGWTIIKVMI